MVSHSDFRADLVGQLRVQGKSGVSDDLNDRIWSRLSIPLRVLLMFELKESLSARIREEGEDKWPVTRT